MQKNGFVIRVEGECAFVSVLRPSECGDKCSNCSGSCNLKEMIVEVPNRLNAAVGDRVELKMMPEQLVRLTFLLYTMPLLIFVIGVFLGYSVAGSFGLSEDLTGLLLGFSSMILSYLLLNLWLKKPTPSGNRREILTMIDKIDTRNIIQG
jgi:sigma-E factor negative regulatory protein RseC